MKIQVEYSDVRLTAQEVAERNAARKRRNAVKGERIKFQYFVQANLQGVTWFVAKFVAKDHETEIFIPVSKLPGCEDLTTNSWYTVKDTTRHYVLLDI